MPAAFLAAFSFSPIIFLFSVQVTKVKNFTEVPSSKSNESPCCGARQPLRLTKQTRVLPTAATRSARFIRHRRRSHRFPIPPHPHIASDFYTGRYPGWGISPDPPAYSIMPQDSCQRYFRPIPGITRLDSGHFCSPKRKWSQDTASFVHLCLTTVLHPGKILYGMVYAASVLGHWNIQRFMITGR